MNLFVLLSVLSLAVLMTYAAPQAPQREPLPLPSDVESIEKDIQQDQAGLEPRNHAKRSYGYGGYYGGFGGYPYYGFGYPYRGYYGGYGHGYGFGGLYGGYGGYGGYGHGLYF